MGLKDFIPFFKEEAPVEEQLEEEVLVPPPPPPPPPITIELGGLLTNALASPSNTRICPGIS